MDIINEDLKVALDFCASDDDSKCDYCYYGEITWCQRDLARDALEQIEKLEAIIKDKEKSLCELEQKVPKWVSVKDRLPDKESMLCLVISDGDLYVSHWHWSGGGPWFFTDGEYDCNVTHWAKAPELPKEEEKC